MEYEERPNIEEGTKETNNFVSASCEGEICTICDAPAKHKIGEEIFSDDPNFMRHNLTAYLCCSHFVQILGVAAANYCIGNGHFKL